MPDMLACKTCGQVHAVDPLPDKTVAQCVRCGSVIAHRSRSALHMTAAFSLAALVLFLPANMFPILRMQKVGLISDNTVWEGTRALFDDGQWGIATIVFLASIAIPLLKLCGLFVLTLMTATRSRRLRKTRTVVYKLIEGVGRWAMLDVFILAILVSLVKLQRLATVLPGPGLAAFTAVVVLTLLASASFDSQLIWEDEES